MIHSIDFKKVENFQNDFGEWIVDAINEKIEREHQLNK
jgi:hypothetical protein